MKTTKPSAAKDVVCGLVTERLEAKGFVASSTGWVRRRSTLFRDVFSAAISRGVIALNWGFLLDYVPQVTSTRIQRVPKNGQLGYIWGSSRGKPTAGPPQSGPGGAGTNPNGGFGRGWNGAWLPEGAISLTPPSLPEGVVNAAAGFGDGIANLVSFGFWDLRRTRDALGVDGGVDEESNAYVMSGVAGSAVGAVAGPTALAGAGCSLRKVFAMFVRALRRR